MKLWKTLETEIEFHISIQPVTPLHIGNFKEKKKEQLSEVSTEKNKIEFMYYIDSENNKKYFIPGASLKGVLRTHTEKIFYTLNKIPNFRKAKEHSLKFSNQKEKFEYLEKLNIVEKLFGSTGYRGRLIIEDAYFEGEIIPEIRPNVAIDRFRGGAKDGALYETESIKEQVCKTTIRLKNAEPWEVFWVCLLLRDLNHHFITVGAKSSIGYGKVNVHLEEFLMFVYSDSVFENWKINMPECKLVNDIYKVYRYTSLEEVAKIFEEKWMQFFQNNR
ncbi:RAMP superfamily CRISPR-associated protein [Bacillus sp. 165]|uniref:RAMP superfamily CRISPR-associated protein n=1 Tax=Bacillus sp. 165 TaxID=1529117 RepID=UPI001ADA067E|nr:RAMP superfamily CRISPR-associated protein [Bacillus sp. 165]MBO9129091.1 hypothetical protein [Bacillus sp. 165]